ncbi:hypothetical protein CMV_010671 [Castanea mollissima]|uniref:Uncharacterized protein n=1 Tax=Castanea mollissima TaxID=60419 RepID=A0A8J4VXL8_9ROSI|nr:hypothetical protein CMV_010671 [Castanea mollissima]
MNKEYSFLCLDLESKNPQQQTAHHQQTATREGYASYSSFPSGDFPTDGDVVVDHASASPEIYEFDDPNPGYSQSLFNPIYVDNGNGNENGYGGFGENSIGIDASTSTTVFSALTIWCFRHRLK